MEYRKKYMSLSRMHSPQERKLLYTNVTVLQLQLQLGRGEGQKPMERVPRVARGEE